MEKEDTHVPLSKTSPETTAGQHNMIRGSTTEGYFEIETQWRLASKGPPSRKRVVDGHCGRNGPPFDGSQGSRSVSSNLKRAKKRDWFVNQACPLFSSSLFPWCLPSGRYTNNFPCKTHTPQAEQLSGLVSAWKADAISVHVRKERGNVNPSIPRFGPLLYHWIRQFRCAVQEAAS